jgi:hypothetical protein
MKFLNSIQTCKCQKEVFACSKNIQTLQDDRFRYSEQFSQLGELQILNIIHAIHSGIDSNLNILRILKGLKPCGKNLVNSLKFYPNKVFIKVNLVGHTCMPKFRVLIQVSK